MQTCVKNCAKIFTNYCAKGGRPFKILHNKIGGIPYFMIKVFDFMWLNDVKFNSASDFTLSLKWSEALNMVKMLFGIQPSSNNHRSI